MNTNRNSTAFTDSIDSRSIWAYTQVLKNATGSNDAINERIASLYDRLSNYSFFYQTENLDREDALQHMILELLEQAIKHPEFAEQKDAYLVRCATWAANKMLDADKVYRSHVTELSEAAPALELDDENDDDVTMWEVIPDPSTMTPERWVENKESLEKLNEALKNLSRENQTILRMLYDGYSESEIADFLHISRPAVSQRKATIRKMAAEQIQS